MKKKFANLFFLVLTALLCFSDYSQPFAASFSGYSAGADSLKYMGHATFKIKTADGKVIYIDPYGKNDYSDSADVVLITHSHDDHNQPGWVKKKPTCTIITWTQALVNGVYKSFTIGNIKIDAVPAYNSNHPKNSCVGYVIEFNGIKVYHAGDTGNITEMADLAKREITYALLPMDAIYTMTPEQATAAANTIKAKYSIPMHTMPPPDTYSSAIVARFTPANKLIVRPNETIALSSEPTSVGEIEQAPEKFQLMQNFPNPFNNETRISFLLPEVSHVSLRIFDLLGNEVSTLLNQEMIEGLHTVAFNPGSLCSGTYFYTLQAGSFRDSKKIVLLK